MHGAPSGSYGRSVQGLWTCQKGGLSGRRAKYIKSQNVNTKEFENKQNLYDRFYTEFAHKNDPYFTNDWCEWLFYAVEKSW